MVSRALFAANAKSGPELTQGKNDCQKIYSILADPQYGGHDEALSAPVVQDCATEEEFLGHISKFFKLSATADQRIVYFTGHGRVKDGEYGFVFNGGDDFVAFSALIALLKGKGRAKTLFILDTCHSGAADLGGLKSDDPLHIPASTGSCVFASSKDIELSHEDPDLGSLFTHYLCQCVTSGNGGQATTNGLITIPDAAAYVRKCFNEATKHNAGLQTPRYSIKNEEGVAWIAKNVSGSVPNGAAANPGSPDSDRLRFASVGATIEDLDEDLLKRYADSYLGTGWGRLADIIRELDLFVSSGASEPNDAAVICFGRRPERFFPEVSSMFSQGDRTSLTLERAPVEGPLISQFDALVRLTLAHLRTIASFHNTALREDEYEIPAQVIREVISNALAHRDFFAVGRVHVHVDEKYVDVTNPGHFPEGHSWESLLEDPGLSLTPNRRVANHLQRVGSYDGIGRGFYRLREYRESRGETSVIFTQKGDIVRCRLLRPSLKAPASADLAEESLDTKLVRYVESRNAALTQTPGFLGKSVFERFVEPSLSGDDGGPIDYEQFLRIVSEPGKNILLTGSAGVGKSWLLQKCAIDLTSTHVDQSILLHLYVPLRELRQDLPLLISVARSTGLESGTIEYALKKHNLVLLFDGMDEIANDRERSAFLYKLAELQRTNAKIAAVISTRPTGDKLRELEGYSMVTLNEWSSDRALAYIHKNANESVTDDAKRLMEYDPDYFRSPIMLSLFLQVISHHGAVPSSPDELYDAVVDTLMYRHDQSKHGFQRESVLPRSEMRPLLGMVALMTLLTDQQGFRHDEFEKIVDRSINIVVHGHGVHARSIIREWVSCGLILADHDRLQFIHRALQEHLSAQGAVLLRIGEDAFAGVLVRIVRAQGDPRLAANLAKAWMSSAAQGNRLLAALHSASEGNEPSTVSALEDASRLITEEIAGRARDSDDMRIFGDI